METKREAISQLAAILCSKESWYRKACAIAAAVMTANDSFIWCGLTDEQRDKLEELAANHRHQTQREPTIEELARIEEERNCARLCGSPAVEEATDKAVTSAPHERLGLKFTPIRVDLQLRADPLARFVERLRNLSPKDMVFHHPQPEPPPWGSAARRLLESIGVDMSIGDSANPERPSAFQPTSQQRCSTEQVPTCPGCERPVNDPCEDCRPKGHLEWLWPQPINGPESGADLRKTTSLRDLIRQQVDKRMAELEAYLEGHSFEFFLQDTKNHQRYSFEYRGDIWDVTGVSIPQEFVSAKCDHGNGMRQARVFTFDFIEDCCIAPMQFWRRDWEAFKQSSAKCCWGFSYKNEPYTVEAVTTQLSTGKLCHIVAADRHGSQRQFEVEFIEDLIDQFAFYQIDSAEQEDAKVQCPWCHVPAETTALVLFKQRSVKCPKCGATSTIKCYSSEEEQVWERGQ